MEDSYSAWHEAYAGTLGPHTPVETEAKNNAKNASKKVIQLFVNRFLRYDPSVTNEDRTAVGVHNRDTTRTPVEKPENQPTADLDFPGIHLVRLLKIRPVSGVAPDFRSDYGVRIFYGILDAATPHGRITTPPATGDDLTYSVFTRKKTYLFDFDGNSGKQMFICLRYENSKGGEEGEGPFGPILTGFIP
jgi:hypothetical protein